MVDGYDNWRPERAADRSPGRDDGWDARSDRRPARRLEPRSDQRLEQRLDQWVSAGRQFVDGVSGARPGSRSGARGSGLRLDHLGRWVEDKLDWLLEDDEGWRESWEQRPEVPQRPSQRQPLEAISRRRPMVDQPPDAEGWPDDESFSVNRWQRSPGRTTEPPLPEPLPRSQSGRALPRSSRRRLD